MNTKTEILKRYRKTPKGVLTNMYSHQKVRNIKNGFGEIGYSLNWLQNKYLNDKLFLRLFDEWVKSGYEKTKKPTIDRINNKKGYEKDNIHLLPWSENRFKQTMERRCRKGRVLQKLNGVLINIWRSQRDVVKTLGLSQPMLSGVLNGKYKKAYGFEWEYENNIHENADLLELKQDD